MTVAPLHEIERETPVPQGHIIGFVDSQANCNAIIQVLYEAGYPDSSIRVLGGHVGIHLLKQMMGGSGWGDASADLLKEGIKELEHGHLAMIINAEDQDQAVILANVATGHGGHGFSYFGLLEDIRLTK